jgi:uncharacterized protein (DUF362 family)
MAKGISIKFKSYSETIPKILELIKLEKELKKFSKIILKPNSKSSSSFTPPEFVESVLNYCLTNKDPDAKVFIAEGSEGEDTMDVFEAVGYKKLAEKYSIGLIDLNNAESEEVQNGDFLKFDSIMYPKILLESFVISLPKLTDDVELEMLGSLSNMIGAFPARYYKGLFSSQKAKIRRWPLKYSLHDLWKCKVPDLAVIDASENGVILAGVPFEMDKQAAKILGKEWRSISHLRLYEESFHDKPLKQEDNISDAQPVSEKS